MIRYLVLKKVINCWDKKIIESRILNRKKHLNLITGDILSIFYLKIYQINGFLGYFF